MAERVPAATAGERHIDVSGIDGRLRELFLSATLLSGASQVVITVVQLASLVVLTRLIDPAAFGVYAVALFFVGLLQLFNHFGLSQAVVQRENLTQGQVSSLFWVNLGLSLVLFATVFAFAPLVARIYQEPALVDVLRVSACSLPIAAIAVQHRATMTRAMKVGAVKIAEALGALAGLAAGVVAALLGLAHWSLVLMLLATHAVTSLTLWAVSPWRPSLTLFSPGTLELLRFGGHVTGFNFLNYLSRNADNALIGWAWGMGPLGVYTRSYTLMMQPASHLILFIGNISYPALSRMADQPARYRRAYFRIASVIQLVVLPFASAMFVAPELFLEVIFGPEWLGGAPIVRWLALAALFQPVAKTTGWLFVSQGRSAEYLRWGIVSAPLSLLAFAVGLPFGAAGVAAAYALSGLALRVPILFWMVGRQGPVTTRMLWINFGQFAAITILSTAAAWMLRMRLEALGPYEAAAALIGFTIAVAFLLAAVFPAGRSSLVDLREACADFWRRMPIGGRS